ncbi:MAG TPA: hypothetical protein VK993_09115 [Chthoniobacterales bacterium]|nr:hypothetical protein [Chthoniobacterales bacterium]
MSRAQVQHERAWQNFERSFNPRRWEPIRNSWADFIPLIDPPGSRPQVTLSDYVADNEVLVGVEMPVNKLVTRHVPRTEVPELVFREAVYWLHKGLHVLGSCEAEIQKGNPTWSLSSAYQSAYFSGRAVLAFLGVTVAEFRHVSAAVDICRDMHGVRPQRLESTGAFLEEIPFHTLGLLFDHRQLWQLFQRVIRVTNCHVWPADWANFLAMLDIANITRQRHQLHYRLEYWLMDDLFEFSYPEDFPDVAATGIGRELFETTRPNFSLILATLIARMALRLFEDLSQITERLSTERALLENGFSYDRHPFFADPLRADAGMPL